MQLLLGPSHSPCYFHPHAVVCLPNIHSPESLVSAGRLLLNMEATAELVFFP